MIVCANYVTAEVNNATGSQINWGLFNYPSVVFTQVADQLVIESEVGVGAVLSDGGDAGILQLLAHIQEFGPSLRLGGDAGLGESPPRSTTPLVPRSTGACSTIPPWRAVRSPLPLTPRSKS